MRARILVLVLEPGVCLFTFSPLLSTSLHFSHPSPPSISPSLLTLSNHLLKQVRVIVPEGKYHGHITMRCDLHLLPDARFAGDRIWTVRRETWMNERRKEWREEGRIAGMRCSDKWRDGGRSVEVAIAACPPSFVPPSPHLFPHSFRNSFPPSRSTSSDSGGPPSVTQANSPPSWGNVSHTSILYLLYLLTRVSSREYLLFLLYLLR